MVLTKNSICNFGWKARDFALKGVDGKTYTLADVRGPKGRTLGDPTIPCRAESTTKCRPR
jgi:hypothetical protein